MKVLVTGATGFVGRYLIKELSDRGDQVRALCRRGKEGNLGFPKNVELWQGDVTMPETLTGVGNGVDVVFHLAAMGHVSAISEAAYRQFYKVNVEGTENIMHALRGERIEKFVHFSSTAAMGLIKKKCVDETDTPKPLTPYQKSKLQSEKAALKKGRNLNIPTVILRPCMIYGLGGYGEFFKIATLMKKGLFPKVGRGLNLTPLVHVYDVTQAAIKAAENGVPGEVYLIASKYSLPLEEMRNMIMSAWGIKSIYPFVPTKLMYSIAWLCEILSKVYKGAPIVTRRNIANTVWDRAFSIKKSEIDLAYFQSIDFSSGITETINWYKKKSF